MFVVLDRREDIDEDVGHLSEVIRALREEVENGVPHGRIALFQDEF